MKYFQIVVGFFFLLNLYGCTAGGIKYNDAPDPITLNKGAIYIIHHGSSPGSDHDQNFYVDGNKYTPLMEGEYTWIELDPGRHVVETKNPWHSTQLIKHSANKSVHKIFVEANRAKYYVFSYLFHVRGTNMYLVNGLATYDVKGDHERIFKEVSEEVALHLLETHLFNQ